MPIKLRTLYNLVGEMRCGMDAYVELIDGELIVVEGYRPPRENAVKPEPEGAGDAPEDPPAA